MAWSVVPIISPARIAYRRRKIAARIWLFGAAGAAVVAALAVVWLANNLL